MTIQIYIRRNGSFGARSDDAGGRDTGHSILEDSGYFTVRSAQNNLVCVDLPRDGAEEAIARDFRASTVTRHGRNTTTDSAS